MHLCSVRRSGVSAPLTNVVYLTPGPALHEQTVS
jgi:hypothetical protein